MKLTRPALGGSSLWTYEILVADGRRPARPDGIREES
jgi:hypothetical protein